MIIVRCKRDYGNKEADPISEPMCLTQQMAVIRGKRFLDDPTQGGYYDTVTRTLKVPHKADIRPGHFVKVNSVRLGLTDKILKVTKYDIEITPSEIWGIMETLEYV